MPSPYTDRPGDRRYAPQRSVSRDRFEERPDAAPRADAQAKLNWQDKGVSRPVKNLGWLKRNSSHVSNLVYERGVGEGDAVLKAEGQHPTRGHFAYEIPFASREVMRDWVGGSRSWQHVSVEDRLRDGGA
jgi:hypothetical protein